MRVRARRRPEPNEALVELPALFARQNTDCSGSTQFYRCSLNNFAGCCSVDPCAMDDGCPDDEDEDEDEEDEDESTTTTTSEQTTREETTTTTDDPETHTTIVTVTKTNDEGDLETSVLTTIDGAVIPTDLPDLEGDGDDDDDSGSGLGGGAIAGIVIGVLALFLIAAAVLFWRRRKQKKYTPAEAVYPPPMDANDEKFLGAADPGSAAAAAAAAANSASTTPASLFGKLGMGLRGSPAPTPSTPSQSDVGGNGASRFSYVSSMTSGSPPPGPGQFTPAIGGAAQLDSTPGVPQLDSSPVIVAEMDGAGPARARPASELPATPINPAAPRGLGVHHGRERSGGQLPTVTENEAPKATLNQTDGRTYVTSWSSYEAVQGPQGG